MPTIAQLPCACWRTRRPDLNSESMKQLAERLERERSERERARVIFERSQLPLWLRMVLALKELWRDSRAAR